MFWNSVILYSSGVVGTVLVAGAVFVGMYLNYKKIEDAVFRGLSSYASELYELLDRMYQRRPLQQVYLMILVPTVLFALTGLFVGFNFGLFLGLVLALILGAFGFKMPGWVLRALFKRRVAKFDIQLVDALSMMSNAIRSGLSFLQVIQVIEKEMPNPCSQEFGMVLKENRVGINLSDALLNMTRRMPSEDLFMIVNSVVTLSQQGGDISEAFETIAHTIRERQRISSKIRTMAQAGITQATILSLMPLVVMGMMWFIQPAALKLLFTTPLGIGLLVLMVVLITTGALVMRKILTIDI